MSIRRVLAISPRPEQLRRITAALEQAGAEVDAVPSVDAVDAPVIPHRYVFIDVEAGDVAGIQRVVPLLRQRAHVAVVTPRAGLGELIQYLGDQRVNHVIVGDELDRGVFVTAQKLLTGDIFGIEKYLPTGTAVNYLRLRDFEGRGKAIDTILSYAEESKMRRQVRSAIGQVCEELLMNALYDAPVDDDGRPRFAHDRKSAVSLPATDAPVLRFGSDGTRLAVQVRDRFGGLRRGQIIDGLARGLAGGELDRSGGGAGLGLTVCHHSSLALFFDLGAGRHTQVTATLDLDLNLRELKTHARSLHLWEA